MNQELPAAADPRIPRQPMTLNPKAEEIARIAQEIGAEVIVALFGQRGTSEHLLAVKGCFVW